MDAEPPSPPLRRGWTTGTCATAAARAAFVALVTGGEFPDPVAVRLPGGERPAFALALTEAGDGFARAGVVKDAGDDPDITHGALVVATVRRGAPGSGVRFLGGPGVGRVTRPGLPIPPGEPAINPMPREMMRWAIDEAAAELGVPADAVIEISIPGGADLATQTLNGRLGIVDGLSVLGTTGIVVPYSCAAWIHSIHRGVDVARASGLTHLAGATGHVSEEAARRFHSLSELALIDMGDFAGGLLKYLRRHPVERVTIAGGFAKMTKLGQGLLDLHSRRGAVDPGFIAALAAEKGAPADLVARISGLPSAAEALVNANAVGFDLAGPVAAAAWETAAKALSGSGIVLDLLVTDRSGAVLARTDFRRT